MKITGNHLQMFRQQENALTIDFNLLPMFFIHIKIAKIYLVHSEKALTGEYTAPYCKSTPFPAVKAKHSF